MMIDTARDRHVDLMLEYPMLFHPLSGRRADAEALILILAAEADRAALEANSHAWAEAVPRSAFASLEIDAPLSSFALPSLWHLIIDEAKRLNLNPSQVVLMGRGESARLVLDLALLGVTPGSSAIIADIPPGPIPAVRDGLATSLRFIQHVQPDDPADEAFNALIQAFRLSSLDIRAVTLPEGSEPASRALESFLIELVANASRYRSASSL